jgi:hypothetical protein
MELLLNLVWLLTATLLLRSWVRQSPHRGRNLTLQIAALAMLLLILFPVISVTDDLQAAQNPAETETLLRRGHSAASDPTSPAPAFLPVPFFQGIALCALGLVLMAVVAQSPQRPSLLRLEIRPPPAA